MINPLFFVISFIRVFIVFLTLFYLPGKAFTNLIFLNSNFSNTAKNLLSIASGIVISSLFGSLFLLLFDKIKILWLYSALMLLVIFSYISVLVRNSKINNKRIQHSQFKFLYSQFLVWILISILGFLFIQYPSLRQFAFTEIDNEANRTIEFYISPAYLNSYNSIPLKNNEFYQIPVEIVNNDLNEQAYLIGISQNNEIISDAVNISVGANEKAIIILNIPYYQVSQNLPIDIYLYDFYSNQKTNHLRVWLDFYY